MTAGWLALLGALLVVAARAQQFCPPADVAFELWTGYVYSAPGDLLDTRPGTLLLDECVRLCAANSTCRGLNYETGLCVLFSTNAQQFAGGRRHSRVNLSLVQFFRLCKYNTTRRYCMQVYLLYACENICTHCLLK